MIKENELRLNNLVMVNYKTDLLSKVTWIQEGSINVTFDRQPDLVNGIVCSVNDLISIPLTEEWLIKFGFNSQYKKGWIGIDVKHSNGTTTDFVLSYPQRMGMWQTFFAFEYDGFRFVEIKYVHQLQNIYFALTNKELELIKE